MTTAIYNRLCGMPKVRYGFLVILLVVASCGDRSADVNWPDYMGGPDRNQYTTLDQITPENIHQLEIAWEYRTGDSGQMQCNPLIIDGKLFATTATNEVVCLEASSGELIWKFAASGKKSTLVNRGVSFWKSDQSKRIFTAYDEWLYALKFDTGEVIPTFGNNGRVSLKAGLGAGAVEKFVTSRTPGTVFKDMIVMPTVVNEGEGAAPGFVQAFDVRTGKVRWVFQTIPGPGEYGYETWPEEAYKDEKIGGANSWAGMSLDEKHEILYVPTGSASPDFYGGDRIGQNLFANSIIALNANNGERIWHYQIVHHDIWDRDLPAPPNLMTITREGQAIEALAQVTKSGYVYVLNRLTGKPIFPIPEMPVPPSDIPGEEAWPTQPIPELPKPFSRITITEEEINPYSADQDSLLNLLKRSKAPTYTPLSEAPTFILPGSHGGAEWGGAAVDRDGNFYVNSNEMAVVFSLRKSYRDVRQVGDKSGIEVYKAHCEVCHRPDLQGLPDSGYPSLSGLENRLDKETVSTIIERGKGRMTGFPQLTATEKSRLIDFLYSDKIPYSETKSGHDEVSKEVQWKFNGYTRFKDSKGMPGISPPWGTLTSIDLNTGQHNWQIPLGDYTLWDGRVIEDSGTPTYGGPLVTENGLLIIASTTDSMIRAFTKSKGVLLWEAKLPFPGFATPSTFMVDGRQYITILCGGGKADAPKGDAIVTFALPE